MQRFSVNELTCYYCKAFTRRSCQLEQELWKCGREATHCVYVEGSYTSGGLLRTNVAKACATKRECDPVNICRTDAGVFDCSIKCCNSSRCNEDVKSIQPTLPSKYDQFIKACWIFFIRLFFDTFYHEVISYHFNDIFRWHGFQITTLLYKN